MRFDCQPEIRKVIYTTNAIESLNRVIRKVTKQRQVFPNRRVDDEGGILGYPGSDQEVDDADPQLETSHEPFYDRIW